MEKVLYTSIALTMTEDWEPFLDSQHAIAIVTNAAPASLPIKIAPGPVSEMPSNMERIIEGTMAIANPVAASTNAVIVSNNFILFDILDLISLSPFLDPKVFE